MDLAFLSSKTISQGLKDFIALRCPDHCGTKHRISGWRHARHRGPEDEGFGESGVGFGMRRLSIVDLPGGHEQPLLHERAIGELIDAARSGLAHYEHPLWNLSILNEWTRMSLS